MKIKSGSSRFITLLIIFILFKNFLFAGEVIGILNVKKEIVHLTTSSVSKQLSSGSIDLENEAVVITDKTGQAEVIYKDKASINLSENTQAKFSTNAIVMKIGKAYYRFTKLGNQFKVLLPHASLGIRGTAFLVKVFLNGEAMVKLDEGNIEIISKSETKILKPGEVSKISPAGKIKIEKFIKKTSVPSPGVFDYTKILRNKPFPKKFTKESNTPVKITVKNKLQKPIKKNLEVEGKHTLIVKYIEEGKSMGRGFFEVFLNGTNYVNGKRLVPRPGLDTVIINNLPPDEYKLEVVKAGTYTKRTIIIDDTEEAQTHKEIFIYIEKKIVILKNNRALNLVFKNKEVKFYDKNGLPLPITLHPMGFQFNYPNLPQGSPLHGNRVYFHVPKDSKNQIFIIKYPVKNKDSSSSKKKLKKVILTLNQYSTIDKFELP